MKLPTLLMWLDPKKKRPPIPNHSKIKKITYYVDRIIEAGKPLTRSKCTTRTLTYYYFLTRAGLELNVCFGMGKQNETWVGHCWLDQNGQPFLEKENPQNTFVKTYIYPEEKVTDVFTGSPKDP